jgi:GDPmannose 4,6-dehydratase
MHRALITGITGQDGSYLAELLLGKGYEVHGLTRSLEKVSTSRIAGLQRRLVLHAADPTNRHNLESILTAIKPSEIYHLAGQTDVHRSFEIPEETTESIALFTLWLLEIVRQKCPEAKLFHAASSEIFGRPGTAHPLSEETAMAPVNPYGCAKAFARQMAVIYRTRHNVFVCNGILFNHESPRRGENFVTRKICAAAARIKKGVQKELLLGDTSAQRDWGHARDFVQGMWLSLQHQSAEDYVFATGQLHSVQQVVELAFHSVELDWRRFVRQDASLVRPLEKNYVVGDASKARRLLNWKPQVSFEEMIREMTLAELATSQPPT